MHKLFVLSFFVAILFVAVVQGLKPEDFEEGPCLQYKPQQNFNTTWFETVNLPYFTAGNRYHMYRVSVGYPPFARMREFEFNYEACLQSYVNITSGIGCVHGFGAGIIGDHTVRYTRQHGVIDFVPIDSPTDYPRHYATLTDNKNFIFFANCWRGSNQKGWKVLSRTPILDRKTQKMIEDHAESLGFDRNQFIFLKYNTCTVDKSVPGMNNTNVDLISSNGRMKTSGNDINAKHVIRRGWGSRKNTN